MTAQISARPPHDAIEIEINIAPAVTGNFCITGTNMPDIVGIGKLISL